MSVPLRVLGDRVLVKPDVNSNAPEQRESGVYLAKSMAAAVTGEDATTSVHRGTVIAVGNPRHPLHHEAESLAARFERRAHSDHSIDMDVAHMLRDLVRRQPCVSVGDDILFSHDAGQETVIDGETYIILHENELLAVIEPEPISITGETDDEVYVAEI